MDILLEVKKSRLDKMSILCYCSFQDRVASLSSINADAVGGRKIEEWKRSSLVSTAFRATAGSVRPRKLRSASTAFRATAGSVPRRHSNYFAHPRQSAHTLLSSDAHFVYIIERRCEIKMMNIWIA